MWKMKKELRVFLTTNHKMSHHQQKALKTEKGTCHETANTIKQIRIKQSTICLVDANVYCFTHCMVWSMQEMIIISQNLTWRCWQWARGWYLGFLSWVCSAIGACDCACRTHPCCCRTHKTPGRSESVAPLHCEHTCTCIHNLVICLVWYMLIHDVTLVHLQYANNIFKYGNGN